MPEACCVPLLPKNGAPVARWACGEAMIQMSLVFDESKNRNWSVSRTQKKFQWEGEFFSLSHCEFYLIPNPDPGVFCWKMKKVVLLMLRSF